MDWRSVNGALVFCLALAGCTREEPPLPPLPNPLIRLSDKFFDVAVTGPERALVVGYGGKILRTEDGGYTWKQVPSGTDVALYRIRFVTPELGWICGQEGLILHSTDGGQSWQRQSTPTRASLFALHFVDGEYGWAVGDLSLGVRTRDGGRTWTLRKIAAGAARPRSREEELIEQESILYDVWFADRQQGWVVGEFGKLLKTTDGGETWSSHEETLLGEEIVDVLDIPTFFGLTARPPGELLATGLEGKLVRSVDGGLTWRLEKVESPFPVVDPLFVPFLFANGKGWAAGASGQVLQRAAADQPWKPAGLGMEVSTWIRGMAWWDENIGWLVGGYGLILHTTDGGRTWSPALG
jgi:photosystem II stability/assembly factor-like uncharacterized protein